MLRKRRLGVASIALGIAVALYQFAPSLAENISQALSGSASETSTATTTSDSSVVVTETSTPVVTGDSTVTFSESTVALADQDAETQSASTRVRRVPPPEVTSTQGITLRIPETVRVDPRAQGAFLPKIFATSLNSLMVCITSNSLSMDVGTQGVVDSIDEEGLKVKGDRSGYLVVSGDPETVMSMINGALGMRVYRDTGGVAQQEISLVHLDLSKPSLDAEFCVRSAVENRKTIRFIPLALEQRISDGKVRLGK
jgi:hypothetical protein